MSEQEEIIRAKCNRCQQETKHDVKATHTNRGKEKINSYSDIWIDWSNTWEIIECRGCETMSVKHTNYFSEWDGLDIKYYPPSTSKRKPLWIRDLEDDNLKNLFEELYIAHEAGAHFLTTTACRTIIERIMTLKIGPKGSFAGRLKKMVEATQVAATESTLIETALEAGHASAHRGWSPKESTMIDTVIGIVENLSERLFILPKRSDSLKKDIPKRK